MPTSIAFAECSAADLAPDTVRKVRNSLLFVCGYRAVSGSKNLDSRSVNFEVQKEPG
jgi:hypothetical protein